MPKPQCQSTNAHANAKAQWPAACGAAAPMESSAAGPRGALAPAPPSVLVPVLLLLLLLSVAEAVEETEAEAVEETEAEAVLLLLDCCARGQVPLTKCVMQRVAATSASVGKSDYDPVTPIAPPQQSVAHINGIARSNDCW